LLQYIHIIFQPHEAIYFVKCTSPSCSKAPHNMLPPPCLTVGMVFVSSDQRTFLKKVWSFSSCTVANRSLALFMVVLEQWLLPCWVAFQVMFRYRTRLCGYRSCCTCFLQHLHKVLCCCSGIDLHPPRKFISRRQNVSPSWAVGRLHGPMVFILA
jgi:hypothetical protein